MASAGAAMIMVDEIRCSRDAVEDENGEAPSARSASDFSYSADEYAGDGWRIIGDAGGTKTFSGFRWATDSV